MSVYQTLYYAYKEEGLEPLTGYNSWHFHNWRDAPFTVFLKNGEEIRATDQGGLALQEVLFLEGLGSVVDAQNCLVIGNAFGWSTVATALTFPEATTVGMDNFPVEEGLELTQRLLGKLGLKGTAVLGESPGDVADICSSHLEGPLDFVLIDADHTSDAIVVDFNAARAAAKETCVYLFHDVINFDMVDGLERIVAESGLEGRLLTKTPSGMAIVYDRAKVSQAFLDYIGAYADNMNLYEGYRKLAAQTKDGRNPFLMEVPK